MQAPDPVEAVLARLMPPALGQDFQAEMEEMIDELVGPVPETAPGISSVKWWTRCLMGGGIAAGIGALFALVPTGETPSAPQLAQQPKPAAPALILMKESDRIESLTDEGWQDGPDGAAMRALRVKAVEENSVRDEESGMEVRISEPREEVILVPVTDF